MRSLKFSSLVLVLALMLSACDEDGASTPKSQPYSTGNTPSPSELQLALDCFDKLNEVRVFNGVPALIWDNAISQVAYDHSYDMRARNFYAHVNPDTDGPGERLTAQGVYYITASENIAMGQQDVLEVMNAWWNSPSHRAAILDSSFTHVGIGVRKGSDGPWWTQNFVQR
jgi:uncharacterized protein YkwD